MILPFTKSWSIRSAMPFPGGGPCSTSTSWRVWSSSITCARTAHSCWRKSWSHVYSAWSSRYAIRAEQLGGASPYCLYCLGRPAEFPLHADVARGLGDGPRRVLAVHNISDGQGDEILRCVPLLQALLDFNPQLEITLLAKRTYLYSHPRLTVVDIRTAFPFQAPYDAIVDFFETNILSLNYSREVEAGLHALIRDHPPFLLVCASKGYNHFVYDRVEVWRSPSRRVSGAQQAAYSEELRDHVPAHGRAGSTGADRREPAALGAGSGRSSRGRKPSAPGTNLPRAMWIAAAGQSRCSNSYGGSDLAR